MLLALRMIAGTAIYSASIKWTGSNVKRIDDVGCYLPTTSYPEEGNYPISKSNSLVQILKLNLSEKEHEVTLEDICQFSVSIMHKTVNDYLLSSSGTGTAPTK
eukprot:sb/3478183/